MVSIPPFCNFFPLTPGSQHTINDPTVSNKHLRIYTIIFDQESPGEVAPLIYAQDLSRYGTLWNGFRVWRHNGGVLLSDGDILRITPGIELKIRCAKGELAQPFDEVQRKEMKVGVSVYPHLPRYTCQRFFYSTLKRNTWLQTEN